MKFKDLVKNESILKVLEEMEYDVPTKIQEYVIPYILNGADVLGQSRTGTGKTIAFALPILENISDDKVLQTLILSPTRELALQIKMDIEQLSKYIDINVVCVYGSSSIEDQIKKIKSGAEIVVGTPGRVKDLINRKVLKIANIKYFVLDEADEMLSMGFEEDIKYIFENINSNKQVMLFSATMPKAILKIAQNYMSKDYKMVSIVSNEQTAKNVEQEYYVINSKTRLESLCRILDYYDPNRSIIFCKTKRNADEVSEKLSSRGYSINIIHGNITQEQRIATLEKFKKGVFKILIATDVASRGIHVDNIDIVFNYNLPENNEGYIHRIGRTGRASCKGLAVTLVSKGEEKVIKSIESYINAPITKKNIPEENEIINSKVQHIICSMDACTKISDSKFSTYIDSLNEEQSKIILSNILNEKLNNSFGSDFKIQLEEEKKKRESKRELKDSIRVFLTIGKMDNIDKRSFLCFLEKTAKVKEGTFTGMEILPKFTFVNVNDKYIDQVLKNCNNIKYNNRLIKIEKAKR